MSYPRSWDRITARLQFGHIQPTLLTYYLTTSGIEVCEVDRIRGSDAICILLRAQLDDCTVHLVMVVLGSLASTALANREDDTARLSRNQPSRSWN